MSEHQKAPLLHSIARELLRDHYAGWKGGLERLRETGDERWSDAIWQAGDAQSFKQYMRLVRKLAKAEGCSVSECRASLEASA